MSSPPSKVWLVVRGFAYEGIDTILSAYTTQEVADAEAEAEIRAYARHVQHLKRQEAFDTNGDVHRDNEGAWWYGNNATYFKAIELEVKSQ